MATWKENAKSALAYKPLQYAVLVAIVLAVAYFFGKSAGKGATVSYPGSKTKDPVTDDFTTKQAPNILESLFQAFTSGPFGWSTDVDEKTLAVQKIINLTDNQLVYIFNRYNQRYLAGKGETLYTIIDGEYFGPILTAAQVKRDILKRMRELGMDK